MRERVVCIHDCAHVCKRVHTCSYLGHSCIWNLGLVQDINSEEGPGPADLSRSLDGLGCSHISQAVGNWGS